MEGTRGEGGGKECTPRERGVHGAGQRKVPFFLLFDSRGNQWYQPRARLLRDWSTELQPNEIRVLVERLANGKRTNSLCTYINSKIE